MAAAAMKHMASNFAKLDKFEEVDFRKWQKKMHFLLSSMSVVYSVESFKELWDSLEAKYMAEDASSKKLLFSNFTNYKMTDSRPVMEQYNELLGILGRFTQHKMNMDEAIQVSFICALRSPLEESDKPKGNNVAGPSVFNMVEHNNSSRYNDNKGKHKHHDNTRADPNKKAKPTCWKCGKTGHIKRDCKGVNFGNKANGSGIKGSVDGLSNSLKGQNICNKSLQVYNVTYVSEAYFMLDDDVAWWVESGANVHVCKDRFWFKTYESLNDGSTLHMGNESKALVLGCGYVDLRLNIVNDNIASAFMSTSKLKDSILWHARLGHVHFKRMQDMSKDGLIPAFDMDTEKWNKKYFVTFIDDASRAVVRLPDPKLKTLGERGIECIFVGYAEHSKAFRFFVIEPNESVSINPIIESRDAIFNENRLSLVFRQSFRIPNVTENISGLVVLKEATKEGFRQKSKIDYFDTYAPVARISTIRLLIAMASIHNLIIHQMDVKTALLNGELEEEVYMNQPQGFIVPCNENKVCKLIKSLYRIKQAPKQWHQNFNEVILSNGYLLNQADKCVYSKFDEIGEGVIICLYVDDMLIFGTDQVQVDLTKEFLSS
ncbi:zinc finger, CCHC-type containing protein, partial [Tanacetum coccineum]